MKYIFFNFIFILLITTSCGFKVANKKSNFQIIETRFSGDKKINYILKNKILINSNKDSNNLVKLIVKSKKIKTVKEKNIKNRITKYEININTLINYEFLKNEIKGEINITKNGFYDVSTRYSQTLTTERNLVNLLTKDLSKEIIDQLSNKLNDL